MNVVLPASLSAQFPSDFHGTIHRPGSSGFDAARAIYQGRAQDGAPALIAACSDDHDVAVAARWAHEQALPIAVRGGGHGSDGYAMPDGAFVIDLSNMRTVTVDPAGRTVSAQPGVLLGELDAACQQHGLVVPAGTVSATGVGGLTLGGGIGHLMRRFGATVDNVIGFNVVTVDGRQVRADATENPDLFWALRGGGGNFAIVTRFDFHAHPFGPDVVSGQIIFPLDQAATILQQLPAAIADAPRELGLLAAMAPAPPIDAIPAAAHGVPVLILVPVWSGAEAQATEQLERFTALGSPLINAVRQMPWTEANSMLDAVAPSGKRMNLRGGYLADLTSEPAHVLIEHAVLAARLPGSVTTINLWCLGGAISEDTAEDDTAFSRVGARWLWEAVHVWDDPALDQDLDHFAGTVYVAMAPSSLSNGYANLTDDLGPAWRQHIHGAADKLARLRQVKAHWDPTNLLTHNKNITPATQASI